MPYMDPSTSALSGLKQASTQFENAAAKVAKASAAPAGAGADNVDLSSAAVSMLAARNDFAGNINMLKVADEMERRAINMLG